MGEDRSTQIDGTGPEVEKREHERFTKFIEGRGDNLPPADPPERPELPPR